MAKKSGLRLESSDIPIVLGMAARDDRNHDIAAWFGVNQGRIKEAKDGKYGRPAMAPAASLPPKGPPGIKGRRLRGVVTQAIGALEAGDVKKALNLLRDGAANYDAHEA